MLSAFKLQMTFILESQSLCNSNAKLFHPLSDVGWTGLNKTVTYVWFPYLLRCSCLVEVLHVSTLWFFGRSGGSKALL